MTHPPQPPGQPGPYGPQDPYDNQGQWGQQPGGYPSSGPQPLPSYPGNQQDPWSQQQQPGYPVGQDPWSQQQPGYPGYPGGRPPKKKTGLIVGVVVGVLVLIGGGVTAIVLLAGNDNNTAAPPASGVTAPSNSAHPSSSSRSPGGTGSGTGKSNPEALQSAVIDAYNAKSAQQFVALACTAPSSTDLQTLQDTLDKIPNGVTYSVGKAPQITGDSGTLTLRAEAAARHQDFPLPVSKSANGNWCLSG